MDDFEPMVHKCTSKMTTDGAKVPRRPVVGLCFVSYVGSYLISVENENNVLPGVCLIFVGSYVLPDLR